MAKAAAKTAKTAKGAKAGKKKSFKKKEKRVVHNGIVHVQATFNNTIVTIADTEGNTISWSSAGSLGFRGSRKGTPFAAQQASVKKRLSVIGCRLSVKPRYETGLTDNDN